MSHSEDDDDDWFNKGDDELLKDLKINTHCNEEEKTEYIKPPVSNGEEYLLNHRLKAAAIGHAPTAPKIPTFELRKLAEKQNGLDAFFYAFTQETHDFFVGQITPNDSMDRVVWYLHIFAIISNLKIPGFHKDVIKQFVMNEELLNHIRIIATKMFSKRYKALWATDHDKALFDSIICDLQKLFLQASKLSVITLKALETVEHILRLIELGDVTEMINRSFLEFPKHLKQILTVANVAVEKLEKTIEIYPTLEELTRETDENPSSEHLSLLNKKYESVSDYLDIQKQALRTDFIISLSACIRELKQTGKHNQQLAAKVLLFEKVQIVLNENFLNASRQEMLFVDVDPNKVLNKKSTINRISTLKVGTLLCFSTNYEFDNLILAVVTYQDSELSQNGFISIEVVRQFNIGNIYDKQLIMFTSPAFFEPYRNVYNYLNTCSEEDFAMKDFIVFGKSNVPLPGYLKNDTVFNIENRNFKPAHEPPPFSLPLNSSQREAAKQALTQKFALIHGPPGTGKTHISAQLVRILVENQTPKPIIVVAYTNESLDKFLLKLSTFTSSIARFGSQTRLREIEKFNVQDRTQNEFINPRLKRLYFITNTEYKAAFEELQLIQKDFDGTDNGYQRVLDAQQRVNAALEKLNTIRMFFKFYAVRECSIVAMTTTCAAKMNFLLRLLECRIVIFEEAAEILESHVLACLTPHIEHAIMIGDHMQLKPYTSEHSYARSCELNVSLFERLIKQNVLKPAVLLTQYRMRPIIAELLCPLFYETLHNDESVERLPSVRHMKENLFFVKHNVNEKRNAKDLSLFNAYEAKLIINLATHLIEKGKYDSENIVILSPYAAQINLIKSQLPSHLKSVRVMTVDSFQGLEATIVLLSLVRNNDERRIGFLKEKNRICVALSRAKHGLYVIGGMDLLASCSDTWRSIESKLESYNLIGTEFPCIL